MSNPNKIIALKATLNPTDECWQLPLTSLKDTSLCLLGWVSESAPIDAGVPDGAAATILSSILKKWNITFLNKIIKSPFNPFSKRYLLKQASRVEDAMFMFKNPEFDWNMQAQAGFLAPLNSPALNITIKDFDRVLNWRKPFDISILQRNYGITGLLLPAGDGDYAAITFFDRDDWTHFEKIIEQECLADGVDWHIVPESVLKTTYRKNGV